MKHPIPHHHERPGRGFERKFDRRRAVIIIAGLAAVAALAYGETLNYGFTNYDDDVYLTANRTVQRGLSAEGIGWAFTTRHGSNWHPLTWISYMAGCELFSLDPAAHRAINLLLHLGSAVLLFYVFYRSTAAPWKSAFIAGVFLLHPLHIESVVWIAERKEVLAGFFWMLTMALYLRYVAKPTARRMLPVFVSLGLGLLSKPTLVTLPFVLLLMDYWPLGRVSPRLPSDARGVQGGSFRLRVHPLVKEKIPLIMLALASSIVTYAVQAAGGAMRFGGDIPIAEKTGNALVAYLRYIGKTLWPSDLAVFYPYPEGGHPAWHIAGSVVILCAVTILAYRFRGRFPFLLVGWLWFLGTLVPVIGIVQIGQHAIADRYMYLPMIGLGVMAAWGAPALFPVIREKQPALAFAGFAVVCLLFVGTKPQLAYWRDSVTLFERALAVTSGNWIANYNLGMAYAERREYGPAEVYAREAVRLRPDEAEFRVGLGQLLTLKGGYEEAIGHFRRAGELNPAFPGLAYAWGYCLYRAARGHEAIPYFEAAAREDPLDVRSRYLAGTLLRNQQRYREAIGYFSAAVNIDPGFEPAVKALRETRVAMSRR